MAEHTFNTRILNKIDTLANWNASSLPIKQGEICLATVAANAGTGLTEPVIMAKIGTGEDKCFAELPWSFYAKASDVLAVCKSEEALTSFVNDIVADMGIASDDAISELAKKVTAVEGSIDELNGYIGDTSIADQIASAISGKADKATTLAGYGITDSMTRAEVEQAVANAQSNVDDKVAAALNKLAAKVSDDGVVNTYKELIDYAAEHGSDLTELAGLANANATAIKTLNEGATVEGSVSKKIADAILAANLEQYLTSDDLSSINEEIDGLADDIDELASLVGDTAVSAQISGAINDLKLDEKYDAFGAAADVSEALEEYKVGVGDALAAKANSSDLAGIATTGNVNDLIQTAGDVIIFDCGGAE